MIAVAVICQSQVLQAMGLADQAMDFQMILKLAVAANRLHGVESQSTRHPVSGDKAHVAEAISPGIAVGRTCSVP